MSACPLGAFPLYSTFLLTVKNGSPGPGRRVVLFLFAMALAVMAAPDTPIRGPFHA